MTFFRDAVAVIKSTLLNLERKHLHLAAAGLAYYLLLSFFPGVMLIMAVIGFLPLQNGTAVATSFLGNIIPQLGEQNTIAHEILSTVGAHRSGLLSFGIISTLWLTSKGVKGIIAGLDMTYEVKRPRRVWTNRVLAFGLAFGVGLLLILGVALTLVGPILESLISRVIPVQSFWIRIWPFMQWSLTALFTFAAVEMLYILAPNVPLTQRITVPGAVVAAAIWMALSWGISFYFHNFGVGKLDMFYGTMATPIAIAVWLNWGALGMLTGAEINQNIQSLRSQKQQQAIQHPIPPGDAA